jgi:hypothetical protein
MADAHVDDSRGSDLIAPAAELVHGLTILRLEGVRLEVWCPLHFSRRGVTERGSHADDPGVEDRHFLAVVATSEEAVFQAPFHTASLEQVQKF